MSKRNENKKNKKDNVSAENRRARLGFWKDGYVDILLVVVLSLIILFLHLPHLKDISIWIDGYGYLFGAWWFSHHLFSFTVRLMKTQAYLPMLIIAFYQQIYNPYFAARLMNFTYAILGVIVMYFLGKEIKNRETGIFSALLYSTIPILYFLGNRSLVDLPLSVMYALTTYTVIKMEKTKEVKWYILAGLSLGATLITKSAGSVLYLIVGLYLLLEYKSNIIKNKKVWYFVFSSILVPLPIIIMNLFTFHKPIVAPNSFSEMVFKAPSYFTYLTPEFLSQYFPIYLIPFTLLGMFFMYKSKRRRTEFTFLIIYFVVYFLIFSILRFQEPRFMAPLAVPISLFAAYFFSLIKTRSVIEKGLVWLVVLIIAYSMLSVGQEITQAKSWTHSGFMQLEKYIDNNVNNDSFMYVGSIWMMHFVTRNVYDNPVKHIKILRKSEDEQRRSLEECKKKYKSCYVEVDLWEWTQPNYVQYGSQLNTYLKTQDINTLPVVKELNQNLNLTLVKTIYGIYPTSQGQVRIPVILFFKYS